MAGRRAVAVLLTLVVLAAACGDDDPATTQPPATAPPTATPASEPTASPPPPEITAAPSPTTVTATATSTTPTASTPPATPTRIPQFEGLFCNDAPPPGNETGYYRRTECAPRPVTIRGFFTYLSAELDAALPMHAFVPDCLQPTDDPGVLVIVGRLCVSDLDAAATHFTRDPLGPDARHLFADGDFIPYCDVGQRADGSFNLGPPCLVVLATTIRLATPQEPALFEYLATCSATHAHLRLLTPIFADLAARLASFLEAPTSGPLRGDAVGALRASAAQLAAVEVAPRVVEDFADSPPGFNPLVMTERALDSLGTLLTALDTAPAGELQAMAEALRADVDAALDFLTAGSDC